VSVRRQQAARTETELLAAAVRVFERSGYLNAKITDITAEAGRATGSFYQHFASKERLLEALLADLLQRTDVSVADAGPDHPDDFRDRDAVRWHVAQFLRTFSEHRTVMVALQQAAIVDEGFARRQREMLEPDLDHLAGHLRRLELSVEPEVAAAMMTNLLWAAAAAPGVGQRLGDEALTEALTDFVHGGLAGLTAPRTP
jgi:AcrR family transcriptional regulator